MNAANLQLEGLLMAIASLNQALVAKGLLAPGDIDHALAQSEQTAMADNRVVEDLSPANRDAILFPIRLLRLANSLSGARDMPAFGELARQVGTTKPPYNDQR